MLSRDRSIPLLGCSDMLLTINKVYHYKLRSNVSSQRREENVNRIYEKTCWVAITLSSHVAGNHQRQQDIFSAFTHNDFNKIISNLKDDN